MDVRQRGKNEGVRIVAKDSRPGHEQRPQRNSSSRSPLRHWSVPICFARYHFQRESSVSWLVLRVPAKLSLLETFGQTPPLGLELKQNA